ncbi:pitrilysin family protein [Geothrix sp. 21YS21S-2]|uniref:M16 family metallopeptidase n=1 Tax=Geothrix sp. 21YS21S-2 TaxID=3068893 RepID=UPI0027BAC0D0|nr:pitrilysin family protein [Geothrix sp. 21YS21S-2]
MAVSKVLVSALAAVLASSLPAQQLPIVERTLANGMRLVMVERHDQPTIAFGWMARVGSANERPGITGLAHLFEHMMFKGSKTLGTRDARRDAELNDLQDRVQARMRAEMSLLREQQRRGAIPDMMDPRARTPRLAKLIEEYEALVREQRALVVKDEMDQIYTQAGATGINASTSQDRTFYIVGLPSNKLELWMWIESDRIANPVFREFYSERDVILEERRQTLESRPGGLVGEAFNAMTWMAHPYTWEVIGWPSDIAQVTREQANEFFATYYAPGNLTAVLVGDFDAEKAAAMAERYLGRIPAGRNPVPEVTTLEPPQPAEQRMIADVETTPSIQVEYKTVSAVHRDAAAFAALGGILGGAQVYGGRPGPGSARVPTGRLHKALVLERKVATGASAAFHGEKYGGTFALRATPGPGHTPEELEPLLHAEVERIARDGVTPGELQRFKNATQVGFYTRLETNSGIRETLAQALAVGTVQDFQEAPGRIQAVTVEDVQRVARQYLTPNARNVLITHRKAGDARPRTQNAEVK